MAEDTNELRKEISERRDSIADAVDQIENRVSPTAIASRQTGRVRQRFSAMADSVFGNDDPDHLRHQGQHSPDDGMSLADRAAGANEAVSSAPDQLRRQAQGNPAAAGMISFGIGLLLGSVLPESRREQRMIADAQPQLNQTAAQAAVAGQNVVEELKGPAKEAAESLKETATAAGRDVKSDATSAARDVKDQTQN